MIRGLNKLVNTDGLGYLMSAYTAHPKGFDAAEAEAKEIAADLMLAGLVVFAPIAYGPGIERPMTKGMSKDDVSHYRSHEFWMPICERFYLRCNYGIVAMTPGWSTSKGIAIEYGFLVNAHIPVHFYDVQNERILSWGEAYEEFTDEIDELAYLSADEGLPSYLQAAHD